MSILTIRFIGIHCFLDGRGQNPPRPARVVLPRDTRVAQRNDGRHIPYIEFEVLDEPHTDGRFVDDTMYPRDLLAYRRVQLDGDRISIRNAVPPKHGTLNVLESFEARVPSLTTLTPGLPQEIDPALLGDEPPNVAAYFDIPYGDLHTGPSNLVFTRFEGPSDAPRIPVRRLPTWIELQIPIKDGEGPIIEVQSFDRARAGRTIVLAETTDRITIGNQLEQDVERNSYDATNLQVEDFRAHFQLYYDIFPGAPANATLPASVAAVVNGCAGIRYP